MFVGSVSSHVRDILADMSKEWSGKPVYVGCSGNFTVERVLSSCGIQEIYGNDVSLYSCLVGNHLAGRDTEIGVSRDDMEWLNEYMRGGVEKIATLLLCTAYFDFVDRKTPYHLKMERHYRDNFKTMHEKTIEKVKKALDGIALREFYPCDVMDYAEKVVPSSGTLPIWQKVGCRTTQAKKRRSFRYLRSSAATG